MIAKFAQVAKDMNVNILAKRLRDLREKRGLSQKEAAKVFGISNFALSRYENGTSNPDPDLIASFAEYYDVSTDYLLGRTNDPTPPGNSKPKEEFDDPELGLWFKELLDAPEERREELRKIWEIIKQREAGRKPGDKHGE